MSDLPASPVVMTTLKIYKAKMEQLSFNFPKAGCKVVLPPCLSPRPLPGLLEATAAQGLHAGCGHLDILGSLNRVLAVAA